MTGKEALEQRIKILEEENNNLKKDINMLCDEKHPYTWRSLMDERNNLRNLYLEKCFKLDEYKRAFDDLKYSIENAIEELKKEKTSMKGLGYKNGREAAYKGVLKLLEELVNGETSF